MKEFQLRTSYGSEVRCSLEIIPEQHHIQVYDWDEENGWEPWATATVQIGGLNENEVAIKIIRRMKESWKRWWALV